MEFEKCATLSLLQEFRIRVRVYYVQSNNAAAVRSRGFGECLDRQYSRSTGIFLVCDLFSDMKQIVQ